MDQPTELERLLTDIRDSQRAVAEDTKKIREFFDFTRLLQKRILFVVLPLILALHLLALLGLCVVLAIFGASSQGQRGSTDSGSASSR